MVVRLLSFWQTQHSNIYNLNIPDNDKLDSNNWRSNSSKRWWALLKKYLTTNASLRIEKINSRITIKFNTSE